MSLDDLTRAPKADRAKPRGDVEPDTVVPKDPGPSDVIGKRFDQTRPPQDDITTAARRGDPTADLLRSKEHEMSDLAAMERRREAAASGDYERLKKAYAAEGVGIDSALKPWDAKAETAAHTTSPVDTFGNAATLFAVLASAFTRTPAINAMNGMAAAINAVKAGDQEGYERAHTAWRDNMELAFKRFNMQHQEFEDAVALAQHNPAAGEGAIRAMLSRYGMERDMVLLEKGMYPEFMEAENKRVEAQAKMQQAYTAIERIREQAGRSPPGTPEWFEWYYRQTPQEQEIIKKTLGYIHPNVFNPDIGGAPPAGGATPVDPNAP